MQRAFSHHILMAVIVVFGLVVTGTAVTSAQMEMQSGDDIVISGALADMGFAAGGSVEVTATSSDDLFVAGGSVVLNGAAADHIIAAGGTISANDIAVHDLIVAGGQILLESGSVADDLIATGGNIVLNSPFEIGGSAVMSGGDVVINVPIGGDLTVSGGTVVINGNVGGDVLVTGGNVAIGSGVTIGGDLTWGSDEFNMHETVTVAGTITETEYEDHHEAFSVAAMVAFLMAAIIFLAGLLLLVLIVVALFPGLMNRSREMIAASPLKAFGIGLLTVVVLPLVTGILLVSVVGISAGLALLGLTLVLAPFAVAAFCYFAGMKLRGMIKAGENDADEPFIVSRIIWTFIAALVLLVIGIIPFLGLFIWFLAYLIGTGAVIIRGGEALAEG